MTTKDKSIETALAIRNIEAEGLSLTDALLKRFPPEKFNCLVPKTHIDRLPVGTCVSVTEILVDTSKEAKQVFPIAGGDMLLAKVVLDKFAAAAGISWTREERLDDGRHPHVCHMSVRGIATDFDGTRREIGDAKLIDLRADATGVGGKDFDEIVTKAKNAKDQRGNPKPRDPANQLMEARKYIAEVSTSKARNRAIATGLAIKRSYTKDQLKKPFIVPKLILDSEHAAAQQVILANMAGSTDALYAAQVKHQGPEVRVIEAEIEPTDDSARDDEPTMNDKTGEVKEASTIERLLAAYHKATAAGMSDDAFKVMAKTQTGKDNREDMDHRDIDSVARAVDAYIANKDDDGMPI